MNNEVFLPKDLSLKLKEKGFICTYPIALYQIGNDEIYPLSTSDPYYYSLDDFDEDSFIAPTISQVIIWLKKNKYLYIYCFPYEFNDKVYWGYEINSINNKLHSLRKNNMFNKKRYQNITDAYIDGIKYIIDKLI